MKSHTPESASPGTPRKRYAKPRLQVYGDLGAMTLTLTNMGEMDGAKGKSHGTRLPPGPGMSAG